MLSRIELHEQARSGIGERMLLNTPEIQMNRFARFFRPAMLFGFAVG
jgi:hypothetical protein